jgi:hypothetical protein
MMMTIVVVGKCSLKPALSMVMSTGKFLKGSFATQG